jgi:hypothetical protein
MCIERKKCVYIAANIALTNSRTCALTVLISNSVMHVVAGGSWGSGKKRCGLNILCLFSGVFIAFQEI